MYHYHIILQHCYKSKVNKPNNRGKRPFNWSDAFFSTTHLAKSVLLRTEKGNVHQ